MPEQPYTLPDKLPGESNADWCRRAAESIPAETLMRQLVEHLDNEGERLGSALNAMEFVKLFTGHGSGVSGAIVRRFLED